MLMPSDFMNKKEKKQYTKNSKVVTRMLIIPFSEFKGKYNNEQKELLKRYREQYSNKEIAEEWDITTATLQYHINKHGLAKEYNLSKEEEEPKPTKQKQGFTIALNGCYKGYDLMHEVERITNIFEGDEDSYEIELNIQKKP